jgi:tRNA uridine 5-carboxymethylaminomethyl modification enzyme
MTYQRLMQVESLGPKIDHLQAAEQVEIQIKYAGYIERQKDEIARTLRNENTLIPMDFDFSQISGLSNEVVAKLSDTRPETIGKAARISGVTPAAVSLLLIFLKKHGLLSATGENSPRISA